MERKQNKERLSEIINIRCTPSMKRMLEDAACVSNLPLREVVRRKLRGVRIPNKDYVVFINELRGLRREVARQGGLIKHSYTVSPISQAESAAALSAQKNIFFKIGFFIDRLEKELEEKDGRK